MTQKGNKLGLYRLLNSVGAARRCGILISDQSLLTSPEGWRVKGIIVREPVVDRA